MSNWFGIFRTRKRLEVPEKTKNIETQKDTRKHKQISGKYLNSQKKPKFYHKADLNNRKIPKTFPNDT